MKLLLVDDDAFLRDMYATKFRESGDDVSVASHGEQALQMVEDNTYDAVIIDMVMPGLGGVELIKAIKKNDATKGIKCIVLSNQGESEDFDAAKEAGAEGYLIKAESIPSEVVQKVHKIFI